MNAFVSSRAPTHGEVTEWLVDWISREAEVPKSEIELDGSLLDYSLSSITATILVGDIEDWLGIMLPPTLAWDYPTISELIDYLVEASVAEDTVDLHRLAVG